MTAFLIVGALWLLVLLVALSLVISGKREDRMRARAGRSRRRAAAKANRGHARVTEDDTP